jgi:adenosine deaminase
MAPTSNEMLGACTIGRHPIIDLLRAGVPCTVNPDDSLLFDRDVCGEYEYAQTMGATPEELVQLARNSIVYAGADYRLRRRWLADLDIWESQNLGQTHMIELSQQQTDIDSRSGASSRCGFPRVTDGEPCRHLVRPGQRCPNHRVA